MGRRRIFDSNASTKTKHKGKPFDKTWIDDKGLRRIVQVVDDRVLVFDPPEENPIAQYSKTIIAQGRKQKDMRYAFDRIFDENCTQEDVLLHNLLVFIIGLHTYRETSSRRSPRRIQCDSIRVRRNRLWKNPYHQRNTRKPRPNLPNNPRTL